MSPNCGWAQARPVAKEPTTLTHCETGQAPVVVESVVPAKAGPPRIRSASAPKIRRRIGCYALVPARGSRSPPPRLIEPYQGNDHQQVIHQNNAKREPCLLPQGKETEREAANNGQHKNKPHREYLCDCLEHAHRTPQPRPIAGDGGCIRGHGRRRNLAVRCLLRPLHRYSRSGERCRRNGRRLWGCGRHQCYRWWNRDVLRLLQLRCPWPSLGHGPLADHRHAAALRRFLR